MYQKIANSVAALLGELAYEDTETFPTAEHGLMLVQNEVRDFARSANHVVAITNKLLDTYNLDELRKNDYTTLRLYTELAGVEAIYAAIFTERLMRMAEDKERRTTQAELEKFWEGK